MCCHEYRKIPHFKHNIYDTDNKDLSKTLWKTGMFRNNKKITCVIKTFLPLAQYHRWSTCEEHKLKAKNSSDETDICILVRIAQYSYNNFVNNTLIEINNNPVIVL